MGYLVISRKVGERIKVGKDVEILITDISDRKVDVAVQAPKEWKIERKVNHIEEDKEKQGGTNGIRPKSCKP